MELPNAKRVADVACEGATDEVKNAVAYVGLGIALLVSEMVNAGKLPPQCIVPGPILGEALQRFGNALLQVCHEETIAKGATA